MNRKQRNARKMAEKHFMRRLRERMLPLLTDAIMADPVLMAKVRERYVDELVIPAGTVYQRLPYSAVRFNYGDSP